METFGNMDKPNLKKLYNKEDVSKYVSISCCQNVSTTPCRGWKHGNIWIVDD